MKSAKMKVIVLSLVGLLLITAIMGTVYARSESRSNHYDGFYQNQFSESRVDLWLKDQDDGWGDPVSKTWVVTNMAPGEEFTFDGCFVGLRTKFPKKVDMGWVSISCNYTVEEEIPQTEADIDPNTDLDSDSMAKYMVITRAEYYNGNWRINLLDGEYGYHPDYPELPPFPPGHVSGDWAMSDVDGDEIVTFYDLEQSPLTNLPLPHKGKGARFEMSVRFHEDAGNEFQGDTFNLTMIFTLTPE